MRSLSNFGPLHVRVRAKIAFDLYQNPFFLVAGMLLCSSSEIIENQSQEA